jgi:uncharacterized protein
MITVKIHRNSKGEVYGFDADDHGDEIVCSAVSALVINTVNSIEVFTDEVGICDYNENGGYLSFSIENIKKCNVNKDVELLFNSLVLGLKSIMVEYSKHLNIIDKEVL